MWNSIFGATSVIEEGSSKILGSTIEATWEISPGECIIGTWHIILNGLLSRIAASLENPKSSSIFKVFKIWVA